MTSLSNIIYSISESAYSLSSLDFSRPENFTTAVLQRGNVTSLIRDVDADERQLLMVDRTEKRVMLRHGSNAGAAAGGRDQTKLSAVTPLRKRMEENPDLDIDEICAELGRLLKIYPAAVEIEDRLNYYKERANALKESIAQNEQLVENQKQQLNALHSSTNYPYSDS
ncbi:hypothetical protein BZA70DRAFT_273821 [Myxozyma melibiosi]|uniref:DASH complex subunit SPC34 n=1 Tax=Myxozyma melibiosi TaxID=54550 RepID=A0ABR1FF55_9ASCO